MFQLIEEKAKRKVSSSLTKQVKLSWEVNLFQEILTRQQTFLTFQMSLDLFNLQGMFQSITSDIANLSKCFSCE